MCHVNINIYVNILIYVYTYVCINMYICTYKYKYNYTSLSTNELRCLFNPRPKEKQFSISNLLAQIFVQFKWRHHGRRWAPGPTAFPSRPISPRPSPRPALPCPARRLCCHVPSRPCRPSLHASSHPIPLRPAPPRLDRAAPCSPYPAIPRPISPRPSSSRPRPYSPVPPFPPCLTLRPVCLVPP